MEFPNYVIEKTYIIYQPLLIKIHTQTPMYPYTDTLTLNLHTVWISVAAQNCLVMRRLKSHGNVDMLLGTQVLESHCQVSTQSNKLFFIFSIENVIEIIIHSHTFVRNYRDIQYHSSIFFCNSNILQNYRILGPGFDTNTIHHFQIFPV